MMMLDTLIKVIGAQAAQGVATFIGTLIVALPPFLPRRFAWDRPDRVGSDA